MKESRVNEIMNRMTAFNKENYTREEILDELFKLQEEMAIIAFGEEQSEGKRFYDISRHYSNINASRRHKEDELVNSFWKESSAVTNCIRSEISGRKGESRTFEKLNYLLSNCLIGKNIEICNEGKKTEIDALVITEKAVFIIEVKNTKRDIFIDEAGQYYRTGEFLKWDSNIGEKLELRETFVRKAAEQAGIHDLRVEKVVVFTNNRIRVQNRCKSIRTCFLNQLTSVIDTYRGLKNITFEEMKDIMDQIDLMSLNSSYKPDVDIKRFKEDFAKLVATIDYQEVRETKSIWQMSLKEIVSSFKFKKAA